jgi:hypothetical protein
MNESFPAARIEVTSSPTPPELILLKSIQKIDALLGWLIECSAGYNSLLVGIKRGYLYQLLETLGFSGESAVSDFYAMKQDFYTRGRRPEPNIEIPDEAWFSARIEDISDEQPLRYLNIVYPTAYDVATYAHTDWDGVASRDGRTTLARYTRGLATIICDPVAYSLNIDPGRDGVIRLNTDASIENGRHRALAMRSLGPARVEQSGMSSWVEVALA